MKKINIAELLRNCPKGMELDCTIFDYTTLHSVSTESDYPIRIITKSGFSIRLTKYGQYANTEDAKCVIFPIGKTTWEGFVQPCEFKDGDIIFSQYYDLKYIAIVKTIDNSNDIHVHCLYGYTDAVFATNEILGRLEESIETRLATEDEKEKLFNAIKENGYHWDNETKTLVKLPKFKVGDRIKPIGLDRHHVIKNIKIDRYILNDNKILKFTDEHHFELVPNKFDTNTLKPFDKVLVRSDNKHRWSIQFFERSNNVLKDSFVCMGGWRYNQCIPYEGNEHLLDTANDCDSFFKVWKES